MAQPSSTDIAPSPARRSTIRDVARIAGVTCATVSMAINGRGSVSGKTREKIRRIAQDLDYQPKLAAQLMRANSTGHIGLILPGPKTSEVGVWNHPGAILANFIHLCEQREVPYHVETWADSGSEKITPPRQLVHGLSDGVLIGGYVAPALLDWLDARKVPWVNIDEPADYCVLSRDDRGSYMAVERLAALGHQRIAYAGGPVKYLTHRLALEGFQRASAEFALVHDSDRWVLLSERDDPYSQMALTGQWIKALLSLRNPPTAVVCQDMVMARTVIYEALRMGFDIPGDLSIISSGLGVDADKSPPPLSTIEVDYLSLVQQSMDILVQRIDKRISKPVTRQVDPNIVMRKTVAGVKAGGRSSKRGKLS